MRRLPALFLATSCFAPPPFSVNADETVPALAHPNVSTTAPGSTPGATADDWFAPAPHCTVGAGAADQQVIATSSGLVQGEVESGVLRFRGIPYASPPTGALRFRPPQPHACWADTLPARAWGGQCVQPNLQLTGTVGTEDCLYLNVWTPGVGAGDAERPVMFWIHGGANVTGTSGTDELGGLVADYDGAQLAASENVVVVSVNYRLGALGFLAHPALRDPAHGGSSGNYGLLDLVAALKWVKANIAAFGGDPSRVMVFGESAGGYNTCALMASPLAAGLFSSAIIESGVCSLPSRAVQEARGEQLGQQLGCGAQDAQCLRSLSASELILAGGGSRLVSTGPVDLAGFWDLPSGGTVDGWVLPQSPITAIAQGAHNRVPLIVGSNLNEMDLFLPFGLPATCIDYAAQVQTSFGALAPQILSRYPCGLLSNPRQVLSAAWTDAFFGCEARRIARAVAASGAEPVYRYQFAHARSLGTMIAYRAYHSVEIPFVFQHLGTLAEPALPDELTLSSDLGRAWGRHASGAVPDGVGAAAWPTTQQGGDPVLRYDVSTTVESDSHNALCDFWDSNVRDY